VYVSWCFFWLRFLWLELFHLGFFLWLRGDGICCVWVSREEGDDSTGIGDTGGGEGITVLWRFACNLVFLEPFLFG